MMKVEYGRIKKYFVDKGYGFVTRTFDNTIRQGKQDVYFHIKTIKRSFPDLAKQLDDGSNTDVHFWYVTDKSDRGLEASKVWLDANDISDLYRHDLIAFIEQKWNNEVFLPSWLEPVTVDLVGKSRADELNQIYLDRLKKADERKKEQQEAAKRKFEYREKVIKDVYNGLPVDLAGDVFWVGQAYRKNPLSHQPGGTDVIVEYHSGQILGYDRIKIPPRYIDVILCRCTKYSVKDFRKIDEEEQMEIAEEHFHRIFARRSKDEQDCSYDTFKEVWNSDTSDETPSNALERFQPNTLVAMIF